MKVVGSITSTEKNYCITSIVVGAGRDGIKIDKGPCFAKFACQTPKETEDNISRLLNILDNEGQGERKQGRCWKALLWFLLPGDFSIVNFTVEQGHSVHLFKRTTNTEFQGRRTLLMDLGGQGDVCGHAPWEITVFLWRIDLRG